MMPKSTLINLLKQGNTGNEILEILESLTSEEPQGNQQPTLDKIAF
jgi:hypothetical protein